MPRKAVRALLLALPLVLGGCDYWYNSVPSPDQIWYRISWFDHMRHSVSVSPYTRADVPRYVVKGSVPVRGGEASWETGDAASLAYAFDQAAADKLQNPTKTGGTPVAAGAELPHLKGDLDAKGDSLYQNFCSPCHGAAGAGNGPVSAKFVGIPSLLTDRARGYTDGYLYSMVRYGRGLMPKYGDKVNNPIDRWAIVNHVRKLQAAAPATKATGGQG